MLPDNNLPIMIGINPEADKIIASELNGELSIKESLSRLSKFFLIRAWFKEPIRLKNKEVEVYTFKSFFISTQGYLCYANRKEPRTGKIFYDTHLITKLEFFEEKKDIKFKCFKDFKKRFDTRFIKEEQILSLWHSKSSQHGGQYTKNDIRKINKRGKEVMDLFLKHFTTIDEKDDYYRKSSVFENEDVWVHTTRHQSDTNTGRDISISHQTNAPHVYYSSEQHKTCNGRYGLIVNKNEYLWLEDD